MTIKLQETVFRGIILILSHVWHHKTRERWSTVVGSAGFEHATPASRTQNHANLDYDPSKSKEQLNLSLTDSQKNGLESSKCWTSNFKKSRRPKRHCVWTSVTCVHAGHLVFDKCKRENQPNCFGRQKACKAGKKHQQLPKTNHLDRFWLPTWTVYQHGLWLYVQRINWFLREL